MPSRLASSVRVHSTTSVHCAIIIIIIRSHLGSSSLGPVSRWSHIGIESQQRLRIDRSLSLFPLVSTCHGDSNGRQRDGRPGKRANVKLCRAPAVCRYGRSAKMSWLRTQTKLRKHGKWTSKSLSSSHMVFLSTDTRMESPLADSSKTQTGSETLDYTKKIGAMEQATQQVPWSLAGGTLEEEAMANRTLGARLHGCSTSSRQSCSHPGFLSNRSGDTAQGACRPRGSDGTNYAVRSGLTTECQREQSSCVLGFAHGDPARPSAGGSHTCVVFH